VKPSGDGSGHLKSGHKSGTGPLEPRANTEARRTSRHAGCPVAPRLLGLEEAAAYLGVSDWTVRQLLWVGELPFVEVGSPGSKRPRRLVDVRDLDAWVEIRKQRHTLPPPPAPRRK